MRRPPGPFRGGVLALRLCAATTLLIAVMLTGRAGAAVYWADYSGYSNSIGRANLNGTDAISELVRGAFNPCGVAVAGNHVYWAASTGYAIGRGDIDGGLPDQQFATGDSGGTIPCGVAVDAQHIYWANGGVTGTSIGRANLDGSDVEQSFIGGLNAPCAVAVDGAHVYWADCGPGGLNGPGTTIGRANIDGTAANDAFITGADSPAGVAVDGAHVYWTNNHTGTIGRAALNGSSVDQAFIANAGAMAGIAVDGAHVYWDVAHDLAPSTIGRAALDGSAVDQNFIADAGRLVRGVAVDGRTGTHTSVAASPASSLFGTPLALTATVTSTDTLASTPAPRTGSAQFTVNGVDFGPPVALDDQGVAELAAPLLLNVADEIGAAYSGDESYIHSASDPVDAGVGPAATATAMTSSQNPLVSGGTTRLAVAVRNTSTDIPPFGSVEFAVDGFPLGAVAIDDSGTAVADIIADVDPGDYTISATYHDDTAAIPDFLDSGASLVQHIVAAPAPAPAEPAPNPLPPPAPAPAPGAPAVTRGDLSSMVARLLSALRAHGLPALRSTSQRFTAKAPGILSQTVYRVAPGRRGAATAARVALASGRRVFRVPGRASLKLTLTAAGRRAVRAGKPLRIEIATRFVPTSGKAVGIVNRASVTRRKTAAPPRASFRMSAARTQNGPR